jgi:hypothetical protein
MCDDPRFFNSFCHVKKAVNSTKHISVSRGAGQVYRGGFQNMEAGAGFRLCGGVFPTPGDVVTLAAPATRARIVNVFVDNSNL